ncbi:hypothetical protein EON63_09795, partial [archaeon]
MTGECMWEMPDEVRFYLPNKLRDKLCRVCGGVEEIEEIKQCFNMLGRVEMCVRCMYSLRLLYHHKPYTNMHHDTLHPYPFTYTIP